MKNIHFLNVKKEKEKSQLKKENHLQKTWKAGEDYLLKGFNLFFNQIDLFLNVFKEKCFLSSLHFSLFEISSY